VEGAQPGSSVARLVDRQPCASQELRDEAAGVGVVVDDEDTGGLHTVLILNLKRLPY
jgi:hypothetical protein